MRYFEPTLQLAVLLPPQAHLEEKFGGLPWGLPQPRWPLCTACKKPQSFIGQFTHDHGRLDLGAFGRVLFIFQCNHDPGGCETWAPRSGANACVFVDAVDLVNGFTHAPTTDTLIETEARVTDWTISEDDVEDEDAAAFYDDARYFAVDEDVRETVAPTTKFGSVPSWVQGAGEGPKAPFCFVAQFDCSHRFAGPAPTADAVGCTVTTKNGERYVHTEPRQRKSGAPPWITIDDDGYYCGSANFGDAGTAYVFVRADAGKPEGVFFWQCG